MSSSDGSLSPTIRINRPPPFRHMDANGQPWRPVPRHDPYGLLDRIQGHHLIKESIRRCVQRRDLRIDHLEQQLLEMHVKLSIANRSIRSIRRDLVEERHQKETRSGLKY